MGYAFSHDTIDVSADAIWLQVYPEIHSQAVDTVITILVVYFVRKAIWA